MPPYFTSQPINWANDYSQDRRGQILGQGAANTGGILAGALGQFMDQKRSSDQKKQQEEQAAQFLMRTQGLAEKDARTAVKGVGLENFLRFAQIDQQKKESEERVADFKQRTALAEAKAQQATNQRNALLQAVDSSMKQQMPSAGPMSVLLPGGASGALQNPNGADPNIFLREAVGRGADPGSIGKFLGAINATNKATKPEERFTPEMGTYKDGTPYYPTSVKSVQVGTLPKAKKALEVGDESEVPSPNGGAPIRAIYTGNGKYIDKVTKAPLYYEGPTKEDPFMRVPTRNPVVFGVDAQGSADDSPFVPVNTPAGATGRKVADDKFNTPNDLVEAVRFKRISKEDAYEIAKRRGWK